MKTSHKPPWAARRKDGPWEVPALGKYVSRSFATQFIAERLGILHEPLRALKDKIGKQIDTALGNGKLVSRDGRFLFGDLAAWARTKTKLAKAVKDLQLPGTASANMSFLPLQSSGFGYSVPATLEGCQEALRDAYRELNQLREENFVLRATVAALRPFKDKADARATAAQVAGKKGGRGNKR